MESIFEPVKRACDAVGGQAALARSVDVPPAFVYQWINKKRPVPVGRCMAIEKATSGKVTRSELRPDDWHLIWPELKRKKAA
jgi:DNA-binding transcriptional regulator YdaS (Cro superfamily)